MKRRDSKVTKTNPAVLHQQIKRHQVKVNGDTFFPSRPRSDAFKKAATAENVLPVRVDPRQLGLRSVVRIKSVSKRRCTLTRGWSEYQSREFEGLLVSDGQSYLQRSIFTCRLREHINRRCLLDLHRMRVHDCPPFQIPIRRFSRGISGGYSWIAVCSAIKIFSSAALSAQFLRHCSLR